MVACVALLLSVASCERTDPEETAGGQSPEPQAGKWATWVLSAPDEVRVAPPPAPGSPEAEADATELRMLARRRGPEIEDLLRRWSQEPLARPWTELNIDLVASRVTDPPAAARAYALVHVAIHDAIVATWHWKYVYNRAPPRRNGTVPAGPDPSYPSEHAAVAGAASKVLAYLFPERSPASLEELAQEAATSRIWAGVNRRSEATAGLQLGAEVAARVIERAQNDGSDQNWDGSRPPPRPAYWQPPPGTDSAPVQPLAGTWRPWVLTAGSQLRPEPPPAYGTPQFLAEARQVMEAKARLTPEQMSIATSWGAGEGTGLPPGAWNRIALAYVGPARMSVPQQARAFAMLNASLADAATAAWDAKYTWWSPRPVNAIRDLGLDTGWAPYLKTPSFPSYVSGHATFSGAAAEVLAHLFPNDAGVFRAKAEEAALSRLYGGIHFPSDNEAGLRVGRRIGQLAVERAQNERR